LRETVQREVFEETGLEVDVGVIAGYREYLSPEGHQVIPAFLCTVTGGQLRAGDDAAAAEFMDPRSIHTLCVVPGLEDVFRDAGILERR
jgi:ADP-ribose pyrophosphatase YjhB (NUDIX family)